MAGNPILTPLTDAQRDAVTHLDGPMLVVAGAGSGKTRVVTHRIAYLISRGVKPWEILAMTFTNKAAKEMKSRIGKLCKAAPSWLGTFHSVCARILRVDIEKVPGDRRTRKFTIFDPADQKDLVKEIIDDLGLKGVCDGPAATLGEMLNWKQRMLTPEMLKHGKRKVPDVLLDIYTEYEQRLQAVNAVDFDDLLLLVIRLLESADKVRAAYQKRFKYILVDEYQDTNKMQYRLLSLLVSPRRNLHVTGDPDQSIYSWRGADYRNIMRFGDDFAGTSVVHLDENFRSTQHVLNAANSLIAHNEDRIKKDLISMRGNGDKVVVCELGSEDEEARWIVDKITELRDSGVPLRNMAIFYRINAQSRAFEESLIARTIPYQIIGSIRFYERKEIKDFIAHLRLFNNHRDTVAMARVIGNRRGIGPKTLKKISGCAAYHEQTIFEYLLRDDLAEVHGRLSQSTKGFAGWCREFAAIEPAPLADCVDRIFEVSGLAEAYKEKDEKEALATGTRVENLESFLARAHSFAEQNPDAGISDLLEDITLVADIDMHDPDADRIVLMTLHSAKGLEFPVVFISGAEEEYLPHRNCFYDEQIEEERRLFFVGVTRAKKNLFITHTQSRYQWGGSFGRMPSRFLEELGTDSVDHISEVDDDTSAEQPF